MSTRRGKRALPEIKNVLDWVGNLSQTMPIIKSAKKAVSSSKRKQGINQLQRKQYKEMVKAVRSGAGDLSKAFKALDKAAKRNVIHRNKANRLRSRLAKASAK